MIHRAEITGLIFAAACDGSQGGVDRGLQNYLGMPLALHATLRLAPQVGQMMIIANGHLAAYESMGVPVWPYAWSDCAGPFAGWLTGLEHCATPYLLTVPCEAPRFPTDLAERLAAGLIEAQAEIAMAASRGDNETQLHPAFCLLRSTLLESLAQFAHAGQSDIARWARLHRRVEIPFDDASAFRGIA